jgi:hypothetical protein
MGAICFNLDDGQELTVFLALAAKSQAQMSGLQSSGGCLLPVAAAQRGNGNGETALLEVQGNDVLLTASETLLCVLRLRQHLPIVLFSLEIRTRKVHKRHRHTLAFSDRGFLQGGYRLWGAAQRFRSGQYMYVLEAATGQEQPGPGDYRFSLSHLHK